MRIGPVLAVTSICASMSVSLLSCGGGNGNNRKGPGTPQYGGKDVPTNTGRVKEQRPDILSPPIIVAPLLNCGTAVVVKGFIPGAEIRILADGAPIGGGPSDAPWGQSFPVNPALKSPSQVTATQTFDGHTSQPSTPVPVQSVTQAYPNGLPKPGFPALPLYRCGRMTAVDSLPPGEPCGSARDCRARRPRWRGRGRESAPHRR
jgi:hypothetical protein